MKKFSKKYPLWLQVRGTEVRKATLLGIQHYLQDNALPYCILETIQNGEMVSHPLNGQLVYRD